MTIQNQYLESQNALQAQWLSALKKIHAQTPFQLYDVELARKNVQSLKKHLPDIEVYYAIKSAFEPQLIAAIDDLVAGYDIASYGECELLRSQGVATDRMLYSNPVKVPDHIKQASRVGVKWYAFDSHTEIKKLADHAPGSNVYLRIEVSDYGSKFPLSQKFGVDPMHAVLYAGEAQDHGLQVRGVTFHAGSQSEHPKTWETALKTCGEVVQRVRAAGIPMDVVNLGGGFPVEYTDSIASSEEIAEVIAGAIKKHLPKDIRLFCEPGRFITANTAVIATQIIGREHRGSDEWLFLDMGVFQGLIEPLEMSGWKYPIFTDQKASSIDDFKHFTLTGPTCDAYDTLGFNYLLPANLTVGDKLYIGTAGAYTTVYGSNFNGFDPPTIHFTD